MRFHGTIAALLILPIMICLAGCGGGSPANPNEWTWVSGSSTVSTLFNAQTGVYGTLGTAAASNVPGGRKYAVSWTDSSGNLWLFGGIGADSTGALRYLNDLWKFNPATKEWTWVSGANSVGADNGVSGVYGTLGVAAADNVPGGRWLAARWIDSDGNLWLFGGYGVDSAGTLGVLNDLWKFDPATKEWTWESGANSVGSTGLIFGVPGIYGTLGVAAAGNIPGARNSAVSWIDSSGNLWLFGGAGFDAAGLQGYLNDLWEFDPTTKEWTWVSGADVAAKSGIYGTLGAAAATNAPGSRVNAVSWIDSSGHLWLFGGDGYDSTGTNGDLNDLWEFSPTTKEWTWVSGSNSVDSFSGGVPGVYGTLGVAAVGNVPSGRDASVSWIDSSGDLWLFGGYGYNSTCPDGDLNDLWEFSPTTKEWTWVSGSNSVDSFSGGVPGVYGTLGTAAAGNVPGGRDGAVSWIDSSGNLWLFGGEDYAPSGPLGYLNDLWKYQP